MRDPSSIPGLGRSPGEGNGNPLQYSCLENPMDGGAWWATVHGVAKSRTRLSDFTFPFTFTYPSCTYFFVFFPSCTSLCILDSQPCVMFFANIFFQFVTCLIIIFMVSFDEESYCNEAEYKTFPLQLSLFNDLFNKFFSTLRSQRHSFILSSKGFF